MSATAGPAADQEWIEKNRLIVERVFEVFVETGEWPNVKDLRRHFAQRGQIIDVQQVADTVPGVSGEFRLLHAEVIFLHLRHLKHIPSADPLIHLCLAITRRAVNAYVSTSEPGDPKISSVDPEILVMAGTDTQLLLRAGKVLQNEGPSPLGGGGYGDERWEYWINEETILDFQQVETIDQFLDVQSAIRDRLAELVPVPFTTTSILTASSIFVLMPFRPEWSRPIFELIGRAAASLDLEPAPVVSREDDSTTPGRITDHIVSSISDADVVVADITGLNPNVMWELGYAHALGKRVVILNQDISASPFDIIDHRQLEYHVDPTAEDEARIAAHVSSAWRPHERLMCPEASISAAASLDPGSVWRGHSSGRPPWRRGRLKGRKTVIRCCV